jgi:hypothetical protein
VRRTNPFQIATLPTKGEFCDREAEIARFQSSWRSPGAKLVAYGDRRLGKTALLARAAADLRSPTVVVFSVATAIDPADAVKRLMAAVQAAIGRPWSTVIQDLARRLRLTVTMSPASTATGVPEFSLGLAPGDATARPALLTDALDALEAELTARGRRVALGIDEFQRLVKWGGEDFEWQLKASLEKHRHISYILTGSATSLIEEMVGTKGRALWKLVDTIRIQPIPSGTLAEWIVARSKASRLPLSDAVAREIVARAGPRTRDVILLARATWEDARAHESSGDVGRALDHHLAETTDLHGRVWGQCSDRERRILRMLSWEPAVEPTSEAARRRHGLGPSSTVTKALAALVKHELLVRTSAGYAFDDPFFLNWVKRATTPDLPPAG